VRGLDPRPIELVKKEQPGLADDEYRSEHRQRALKHLGSAKLERNYGNWTRVLDQLKDALSSAMAAQADDVCLGVIAELQAAITANPRGQKHSRASQLLDLAQRYRETHAEAASKATRDAPGTPGVEHLNSRMSSLLVLLPYGSVDVTVGDDSVRRLVSPDSLGDIKADLSRLTDPAWLLLRAGYDRGYATFAEISLHGLREAQPQIERTLKSIAAQLVAAGATVKGLATDATPLITFALLHGEIPIGLDATASPASAERIDNAVLAIADDVAAMPAGDRTAFIDLYRLSLLLGAAQGYAERLSLTVLLAV